MRAGATTNVQELEELEMPIDVKEMVQEWLQTEEAAKRDAKDTADQEANAKQVLAKASLVEQERELGLNGR